MDQVRALRDKQRRRLGRCRLRFIVNLCLARNAKFPSLFLHVRVADLAGVAQDQRLGTAAVIQLGITILGAEVGDAEVVEVSGGAFEFAGSTKDVRTVVAPQNCHLAWVAVDQGRLEDGNVEADGVSAGGDPVVLNLEVGTVGSKDGGGDRTFKIAEDGSKVGLAGDGIDVGHENTADFFATAGLRQSDCGQDNQNKADEAEHTSHKSSSELKRPHSEPVPREWQCTGGGFWEICEVTAYPFRNSGVRNSGDF